MTTGIRPYHRGGLELEPNGSARHGGAIDRAGGMEIDPNGVYGASVDPTGLIERGGLDIEPNG